MADGHTKERCPSLVEELLVGTTDALAQLRQAPIVDVPVCGVEGGSECWDRTAFEWLGTVKEGWVVLGISRWDEGTRIWNWSWHGVGRAYLNSATAVSGRKCASGA